MRVRSRQMRPLRRARRLPRPPRALARPRRPARKRRWAKALALLAVLVLVWLLWPAPDPAADAPALPTKIAGAGKPAEKVADKPGKLPDSPADKLHAQRPGQGAGAAPAKPSQAAARLRARRDLLLAAVRARAATLRPCVPGDAVALRVPVRLHLVRTGAVKSVDFAGEPPPRALRECVRRVATGWNFRDLELRDDFELFATLALSPGA